VWHDSGRWLGRVFCEKMKFMVLRCKVWNGLQVSPNEYLKILGTPIF